MFQTIAAEHNRLSSKKHTSSRKRLDSCPSPHLLNLSYSGDMNATVPDSHKIVLSDSCSSVGDDDDCTQPIKVDLISLSSMFRTNCGEDSVSMFSLPGLPRSASKV